MSRSMRRSLEDRSASSAFIYGIDGCRGGWVVARSRPDFTGLHVEITSHLAPIFAKVGARTIVAIDIPIGIPENEPRICGHGCPSVARLAEVEQRVFSSNTASPQRIDFPRCAAP